MLEGDSLNRLGGFAGGLRGMSTFFSLASGGSVVLLCSVSLSSQSDLTIDNFALATGTLVLLFLGGQTLMLCEMGA